VAHRQELEELLSERLSQGDAADWVARLNEAGVPAGLVNTVAQVLQERDTAARLVTSAPAGPHEIPQVRTPIRFDGAPLPVRTAPPGLGDDDEASRAALEVPT
jgi:crotonobetainyl-CoA:carnitine CoA-transferase CaiB-like acyl-CoA transferase